MIVLYESACLLVSANEVALLFDFESVSGYNVIHKRIEYTPTDVPNLYNLALGDVQETGEIDDSSVSNNNDRDMVLATVIETLLMFFRHYPQRAVYIEGNDERRTRLYRAVIGRELDNSRDLFDIYGIFNTNDIETFAINRPYTAFIIRLKRH